MALFAGVTTAFSETNGSEIFGGLPIPVATDIVFALAFMSFFSNRVPKSLRAFVLAFAVIDDLIGLCMVFVLQGTISPTAVAVVIGFLIPVHVGTFQLRTHLLAKLLIVNSFIVLPLFALANGGISFAGVSANDIISEPLFWAIITAQFFGKVLGIYGVSLYAIKSPKLSIPWGCDKRHMFLASGVASIGFTLSIFLAKVAFENDTSSLLVAKLAVVVASVIAVVFSSILVFRLPEATQKSSIQI